MLLLDALALETVMTIQKLPAVSEHRPVAINTRKRNDMDMGKILLMSPSIQELINAPAIRSGADAYAPPVAILIAIADVQALLLIKPKATHGR